MSPWLEVLLGWAVALPLVTVLAAALVRGGRLDDEARLRALRGEAAGESREPWRVARGPRVPTQGRSHGRRQPRDTA